MKDLSMHILDIVQNSVRARASDISVCIMENVQTNKLEITITDNGTGMEPSVLAQVCDPYVTTRTTRKIGMGLSLLKQSTSQSDGSLEIKSEKNRGTTVCAKFRLNHIDMPPLGDVAGTIWMIMIGNPEIDINFTYELNNTGYHLSTKELKSVLGNISLTQPQIRNSIREMIESNLKEIRKGTINQ